MISVGFQSGQPKMRPSGFTLLELLVCVVIVAIFASMAMPMAEVARQRNQEEELRHALRTIRDAIDAYKDAVDAGFIRKASDESGYPVSLKVLVDVVENAKNPSGDKLYFLRRIPRDPFYPDKEAEPEKTWGLRSYASSAVEPRSGRDVYDVYSAQLGVGLDGTVRQEW